jgi:hypothetical protein
MRVTNANRYKSENHKPILLAGVLGLPFVAGACHQSLVKKDICAEGEAALIVAASRNDVEMADLLLRAGADPKAANGYGPTALYAAAANADPTSTKKLLGNRGRFT